MMFFGVLLTIINANEKTYEENGIRYASKKYVDGAFVPLDKVSDYADGTLAEKHLKLEYKDEKYGFTYVTPEMKIEEFKEYGAVVKGTPYSGSFKYGGIQGSNLYYLTCTTNSRLELLLHVDSNNYVEYALLQNDGSGVNDAVIEDIYTYAIYHGAEGEVLSAKGTKRLIEDSITKASLGNNETDKYALKDHSHKEYTTSSDVKNAVDALESKIGDLSTIVHDGVDNDKVMRKKDINNITSSIGDDFIKKEEVVDVNEENKVFNLVESEYSGKKAYMFEEPSEVNIEDLMRKKGLVIKGFYNDGVIKTVLDGEYKFAEQLRSSYYFRRDASDVYMICVSTSVIASGKSTKTQCYIMIATNSNSAPIAITSLTYASIPMISNYSNIISANTAKAICKGEIELSEPASSIKRIDDKGNDLEMISKLKLLGKSDIVYDKENIDSMINDTIASSVNLTFDSINKELMKETSPMKNNIINIVDNMSLATKSELTELASDVKAITSEAARVLKKVEMNLVNVNTGKTYNGIIKVALPYPAPEYSYISVEDLAAKLDEYSDEDKYAPSAYDVGLNDIDNLIYTSDWPGYVKFGTAKKSTIYFYKCSVENLKPEYAAYENCDCFSFIIGNVQYTFPAAKYNNSKSYVFGRYPDDDNYFDKDGNLIDGEVRAHNFYCRFNISYRSCEEADSGIIVVTEILDFVYRDLAESGNKFWKSNEDCNYYHDSWCIEQDKCIGKTLIIDIDKELSVGFDFTTDWTLFGGHGFKKIHIKSLKLSKCVAVDSARFFYNMPNLTTLIIDYMVLPGIAWGPSSFPINSITDFIYDCQALVDVRINCLIAPQITSGCMFYRCRSLETLDLRNLYFNEGFDGSIFFDNRYYSDSDDINKNTEDGFIKLNVIYMHDDFYEKIKNSLPGGVDKWQKVKGDEYHRIE